MWALIAVSAASSTFLRRGAMLICLLTNAPKMDTLHMMQTCLRRQPLLILLWVWKEEIKLWCWPYSLLRLTFYSCYMSRCRSYTGLTWWNDPSDNIQNTHHHSHKGATGISLISENTTCCILITSNDTSVCLPPTPFFGEVCLISTYLPFLAPQNFLVCSLTCFEALSFRLREGQKKKKRSGHHNLIRPQL